jgi:hypothetical protein
VIHHPELEGVISAGWAKLRCVNFFMGKIELSELRRLWAPSTLLLKIHTFLDIKTLYSALAAEAASFRWF